MSTQTARIRPFAPGDYAALVAACNRTFPDYPWSVKEMRHQDEKFDTARFFKIRLVAEEDGAIVGSAEAGHRPSRFVRVPPGPLAKPFSIAPNSPPGRLHLRLRS